MPTTWQVDLSDGRTVEVESDTEPTEDELFSSLSSWQEPEAEQPQAPPASRLEPPSQFSDSLMPSLIGGQPSFLTAPPPMAATPRAEALASRERRGPSFEPLPADYVAEQILDPSRQPQPGAISRLITEGSTAPIGLGTFGRFESKTTSPGSPLAKAQTQAEMSGRAPVGISTPTSQFISALPEGKIKDLSAGAYNAAANAFNFFVSPAGWASLGIGNLPPIPQRALAAKFAYDMAKAAPDQLGAGDEAYQRGDMQAASAHWLGGATSIVGAGLAGAHAASPIKLPAIERRSPPVIQEVITAEPTATQSKLLRDARAELPEQIAEEVIVPPEAAKEVGLSTVLDMSPEQYFDTASKWSAEAVSEKGGINPQVRAELAAQANPDLKAWQEAQAKASEDFAKIKKDVSANPELMGDPSFQKRFAGAAQRASFFSEGRAILDGSKQPNTKTGELSEASASAAKEDTPPTAQPASLLVEGTPEAGVAAESVRQENLRKQALREVERQKASAPVGAKSASTESPPPPVNVPARGNFPARSEAGGLGEQAGAPDLEAVRAKRTQEVTEQRKLIEDQLVPAVQYKGKTHVGEVGETHAKLINRLFANDPEAKVELQNVTTASEQMRGFAKKGTTEFIDRNRAAEMVGMKDGKPLYSEWLNELRKRQTSSNAPKETTKAAEKSWSLKQISDRRYEIQISGNQGTSGTIMLKPNGKWRAAGDMTDRSFDSPQQAAAWLVKDLYGDIPAKAEGGKGAGFFPRQSEALGLGEQAGAPNLEQIRAHRAQEALIDKAKETMRQPTETGKAKLSSATGPAKAVDWTSATEDAVESVAPESGKTEPPPDPNIIEMGAGIPIPKFADRTMSPLDRVTTSHSGKLQKSFSEARLAQNEIEKAVPSERRQSAVSIWREANGDIPTLQAWAAAAKGKAFKQAAIDAQSLTPKEVAIVGKAIAAFDAMEKRGNTFDVLGSHRDNYIPHVWDIKRPGSGFGTGMLKQRFRFAKARTFNTFFEGDQAGFKPKTLAIGKLLPAYIHEMNRVIADRQAVRDLAKGTMSDGSPMVVPKGNVKAVDGAKGKAVLVSPKAARVADTSDYRVMSDQPALSNWIWEGKDTDGNPVFVNADLAVHPDVFRRLTAILGQSAIRTWYHDPVSGTAQIPRAIVRGLDTAQGAMKREMFGLLAPFHQVQEGTHAIGHLVNPFFGLEKVDLVKNPKMADAANHGLMLLPDRASARVYLEGVGTKSSLLSQGLRKTGKFTAGIGEVIADVIDGYQDYLFHQYIPALKFKTYEAMVARNTKLYAKELVSGEMTPADVKLTSAEQANAAYGHLNYALLDRNPTIQHMIQLAALAPDFLEARVRFAGQGVKGLRSKVGREQFKAIAILAAAQAGTAAVLSQLLGVDYDEEHPFEVIYQGRRYAMRSVPEDIFGLLKDTRQFVYSRVNPLTVKGSVQLATGLNYRGEKVTSTETMAELLAGYIPITARAIPAVRSLTETGRKSPVTPLQQLAGSLGLRVSRYSPVSETYRLAGDWMEKQKLPKDRGSYPVSKYQQLRYALEDGDLERAKTEYEALKKDMPPQKVRDGFKQSINHPFTGSEANDKKFVKTLTGYDRELYDQAVRTRKNILKAFKSF